MPAGLTKSASAFRTIGELADELGVPRHILRYWETRFPQLRPLQRAGNRRYYRAEDAALAARINRLLNQEGYTIKGVQQLLRDRATSTQPEIEASPAPTPPSFAAFLPALIAIRERLAKALAEDEGAARI